MDQYEVYLHNVPKVSDDGKVVPIEPHQKHEFPQLEEASKFAAGHKDKFERVVVMHTADEKQRMVERYMDGEHIVPEPKEEEEEEEKPAEAQEEAQEEAS